MRSFRRDFRFALAAGILTAAAATLGVTSRAAGPEITPDQMKGVSFEGLTEARKGLAFSILSDQRCDCGCGMSLAGCRAKDSSCNRSLGLATQVLDLVKQGKGREEIIRAVLSPPSKYVQFDLPVGESPSVGPADAKVTILYYLDHQ